MLCDHFAVLVIDRQLLPMLMPGSVKFLMWSQAEKLFWLLGRFAFPICSFMLVESLFYTRSLKRYALRLGLFALVSEVPFNLAVGQALLYPGLQNVFFMLLIALLTVEGLAATDYKNSTVVRMLIISAGCLISWVLRTDYAVEGVILVVLLYYTRGDRKQQCFFGAVWMLCNEANPVKWMGIVLAFLLLYSYENRYERVRFGAFFYWFYPLHLLLLSMIRL